MNRRVPRKRIAQEHRRANALQLVMGMSDERFNDRDAAIRAIQSHGVHPLEASAMWETQALVRRGRASA